MRLVQDHCGLGSILTLRGLISMPGLRLELLRPSPPAGRERMGCLSGRFDLNIFSIKFTLVFIIYSLTGYLFKSYPIVSIQLPAMSFFMNKCINNSFIHHDIK